MANRNSLPLEKVCVLSLAVQNNMQAVGTNILDFLVGYPRPSQVLVKFRGMGQFSLECLNQNVIRRIAACTQAKG